LKARHFVHTSSPEQVRKGIALCQQAIQIDPTYAAAYAWMAHGYGVLAVLGFAPVAEVYPQAIAAAKKAIELDDTLAVAHVSLAFLSAQRWDFAVADREQRRALELDPDLAEAHNARMMFNLLRGRLDDAITAGKRAVELDPLSGARIFSLGLAYYFAKRLDVAIEQMRKAMEIEPENPVHHLMAADAYAYAGQPEKAIEECEKALAGRQNVPTLRLMAATTYAKVGRIAEARSILDETEKAWTPGSASSTYIAAIHGRLGEKDAAFEWLEKALRDRVGLLVHFKSHPLFDDLHGDPRFEALVKRIGIPD